MAGHVLVSVVFSFVCVLGGWGEAPQPTTLLSIIGTTRHIFT